MLQLRDPNRIQPRGSEVLVRYIKPEQSAGGLYVPKSAQMGEENPFPFCRVIAVGARAPDDLAPGMAVGVSRMHWNVGHFSFGGDDFALVDEDGIIAFVDGAIDGADDPGESCAVLELVN